MHTLTYSQASERTLMIDLPNSDGLKVKTILRGPLNRPVVLLIHGRPGTADDVRMYLFARYLHEQGISTLRIFLYDDGPETRDLLSIQDVSVHAADVTVAVEYIRQQGALFVAGVGHSYGGLAVLKSESTFDAVVLWDPSHGLFWQELDKKPPKPYREYTDTLVMDKRGKGYIISRAMSDADRRLGDTSPLAERLNCPLFVVTAGKGTLAPFAKHYYGAASEPKKYLNIPGATHLFLDSDEVLMELFETTGEWLKEIINEDR